MNNPEYDGMRHAFMVACFLVGFFGIPGMLRKINTRKKN